MIRIDDDGRKSCLQPKPCLAYRCAEKGRGGVSAIAAGAGVLPTVDARAVSASPAAMAQPYPAVIAS